MSPAPLKFVSCCRDLVALHVRTATPCQRQFLTSPFEYVRYIFGAGTAKLRRPTPTTLCYPLPYLPRRPPYPSARSKHADASLPLAPRSFVPHRGHTCYERFDGLRVQPICSFCDATGLIDNCLIVANNFQCDCLCIVGPRQSLLSQNSRLLLWRPANISSCRPAFLWH